MAAATATSASFTDYNESGPFLNSTDKHKLNATFRLRNSNVTIANTLRRAILTQTPSVGFRTEPYEKSDVAITINTTNMVNEMIAHRIGMIPINADPTRFNPDNFTFELDVENTSKERNAVRNVHATDFRVLMRNPENPLAAPIEIDPKTFFPPDSITGDSILIARLHPQWNSTAPPERIQLRARASISTGGENIRWSPVSQASYEYTRDTDPDHVEAVYQKWLATAKKIDESTAVDPTRQEALRREFETMEIQRCYLTDAKGDPNDFKFHLESVGIQPIPTIMEAALASCEALVTKYMDIDGVVPDNVRVQVGDSAFPSIDFVFGKETHTLGNLLETWLIENVVSDLDDSEITYAGYKVPHPLLAEMVVRVGVREGMDVDVRKTTARRAIAKACRALKDEFRHLRAAWVGRTMTSAAAATATE